MPMALRPQRTEPEGTPRALDGGMALEAAAIGSLLVLSAASGCVPSSVIGPLQHEQDDREKLLVRARRSAVSEEVLNTIAPPLTPEEVETTRAQNASCRSSYLWKNGMTWTGSVLVAIAAGVTIGAAYATNNHDTTGTIAYGVSAGSLAAVGSIFVAGGGIVQQAFTDRGCWVR
jgi:hypothetical protein